MKLIKNNMKTISIVCAIFITVFIVHDISLLFGANRVGVQVYKANTTILQNITFVLSILIMITALIYTINVFSKKSALFYRLFFILSATQTIIGVIMFSHITRTAIIYSIVAICSLVLAFAKDLGKQTSIFLVLLSFGAMLIETAAVIIYTVKGFYAFDIRSIESLFKSLIPIVFVACKYADKDIRETK